MTVMSKRNKVKPQGPGAAGSDVRGKPRQMADGRHLTRVAMVRISIFVVAAVVITTMIPVSDAGRDTYTDPGMRRDPPKTSAGHASHALQESFAQAVLPIMREYSAMYESLANVLSSSPPPPPATPHASHPYTSSSSFSTPSPTPAHTRSRPSRSVEKVPEGLEGLAGDVEASGRSLDGYCSGYGFEIPRVNASDPEEPRLCECVPFRRGSRCRSDRRYACRLVRTNPLDACVEPQGGLSRDRVCNSYSLETPQLVVQAELSCAFLDDDGEVEEAVRVDSELLAPWILNYSWVHVDPAASGENETAVVFALPEDEAEAVRVKYKIYNLNRMSEATMEMEEVATGEGLAGNVTFEFPFALSDIPRYFYAGGRVYSELVVEAEAPGYVSGRPYSMSPLIIDVKEMVVGPTDDGELDPTVESLLIALGVVGGLLFLFGLGYAYYWRERAMMNKIEEWKAQASVMKPHLIVDRKVKEE